VSRVPAQARTDWDAGIDWPAVGEEALDRLRAYVRFRTVNDPDGVVGDQEPWRRGHEAPAAECWPGCCGPRASGASW
jgi:hypothetical protein